jgi:Flp pilus assembly protein TadG
MSRITMRAFNSMMRLASSCVTRFTRDRRAVSAVEFALILPLMVLLYSGCVDLTQGISIDRKVTITARTVADLVAQVQKTTGADVNNALGAAAQIMEPYPVAGVTVSLVKIDKTGKATIVWSLSRYGGPPHKPNDVVTVDSALKTPNNETYLVWGEATFSYSPIVGIIFKNTLGLSGQIFMSPRVSASVECSSCT